MGLKQGEHIAVSEGKTDSLFLTLSKRVRAIRAVRTTFCKPKKNYPQCGSGVV